MDRSSEWKQYWDQRSSSSESDVAFDRGVGSRGQEIEDLAEQELLRFIDPRPSERVLDAGCGTGANITLLHARVKQITGIDYSRGAIERCHRRIADNGIQNVEVMQGTVTQLTEPDKSFDKVICMSVLQYLDDASVRLALVEFARVIKPGGTVVLHVKNLSSLYLATLSLVKKVKRILGRTTKLGYYRTYGWYVKTLRASGFELIDYNSFDFLTLPMMPGPLVIHLQKLELRNHTSRLFQLPWIRRRGAELKIKARLRAGDSSARPNKG